MYAKQAAALPLRWTSKGEIRVLMVTSRDTGRWVVPKGWLLEGHTEAETARVEALEEAGVLGPILPEAIARYEYSKRLDDGQVATCSVGVFPMLVEQELLRWKEQHQRVRSWFTNEQACMAVQEPGLAKILIGSELKRAIERLNGRCHDAA
ncbi:MAG: NUDIX hydrolase [Rhodobacter sp.]|nr:NUDIX hydrolase [Rhodobacter sp.]